MSSPEPPPNPAPREPQPLDFTRRTFALREVLDGPCTYRDYTAAMHSLARVNRLTRGHTPILNFLARTIARTGVSHQPLHLVDLGAGHGDLLRTIHTWAAKRSIPFRLTGVDLHPYATRLARECDRRAHIEPAAIHHITSDIFTAQLSTPADLYVSSLVAHHLPDEAIVPLLQTLATASTGFYLLDLRRSARAARLTRILGAALRWHPTIRHDAPISFARAFSLEEWRTLVARAHIQAHVHDLGSGRLAISSD